MMRNSVHDLCVSRYNTLMYFYSFSNVIKHDYVIHLNKVVFFSYNFRYITFCLLHENNHKMSPSAGKSPPSSTRSSSSYDIKDVRPEFSNDAVEKVNFFTIDFFSILK